jgi:hypothetical protein
MKNQLWVLLGLGLLLASASAYAKTGLVKAKIPFSFIVEQAALPAGEYTIQSLSDGGRAVTIQSSNHKFTKMFLPHSCQSQPASETTRLVFHRYGDQYFLAQVWMAGNDIGREVPQSRREAEIAMNQAPLNIVVVATLR